MPRIRCLSVVRRRAPAADGVQEYTLEPLPLSALLIWVSGSVTTANTASSYADIVALLPNIELTLAGTTLWQGSLEDLAAYHASLLRYSPRYVAPGNAVDDLAQLHVALPLARRIGDPNWCLPATPAGQLRLRITEDVANGTLDTLTYSIDAVHVEEASPNGFLRSQTLAFTPGATGDFNLDLPVGRILEGCLVFATTQRVTQAGNRGINRMTLLRDSVEEIYASVEWENAQGLAWALGLPGGPFWDHTHVENTAAAYTQNALTLPQKPLRGTMWQHAWLEFDPLADYSQGLDLTQCNRAQLRLNMGVAEATRVLPVERWLVSGTQSTAMVPTQ